MQNLSDSYSLYWQIALLEAQQESLSGAAAAMDGLRKRVQELRVAAAERNLKVLAWPGRE